MTATTPTPIEQRLTEALAARADQVSTEDLTTLLVPAPRRPRRTAVVASLVAAAAVAAVLAVPLLRGEPTDQRPAPAVPSPSPSLADGQGRGEVRADLDGDGADDVARIVDDELRVALASGPTASFPITPGSRVLPPAGDVGTRHPVVVVVPPAGSTGDELVVVWQGGTIATLGGAGLVDDGRGRTVWVDDIGMLHTAEYDPDLPAEQRVHVEVTSYWVENGELLGTPAGSMCWDRRTHAYPVSCEQLPAQDADPSLMFPMVEERLGVGEHFPEYDGQYNDAVLERHGDGAELVFTWDAVEHRAAVPAGAAPELVDAAIASSVDAPAFVVAQEAGETTTMTVFAPSRRGFGPVPTQDGSFLGDRPAGADGEPAQRTWVAESSALWTARQVSGDEPSRYTVVRWREEGGVLVPDDQGEACLDLDAGRRLSDASCGIS